MNEKRLGKIRSATFGELDGRLGFWFDMGGQGWWCGTSFDTWAVWDNSCEWKVDDRDLMLGTYAIKVYEMMKKSNVHYLSDLVDVPIEATFDGNMLKSWRILEEVL